MTRPVFEASATATSTVLRFFPRSTPGKPGAWGFGHYYTDDGAVRICRMETVRGVAVCVSGTTTSGERVGAGKVEKWDVNPKSTSAWRRFFENL